MWTYAWATNAYIMGFQVLNFLLLALGAFIWDLRVCATFCNCCCAGCHLLAIAFALYLRYNPLGRWCAINVAGVHYEDSKLSEEVTYKLEADAMTGLAVAQCLFVFAQCCCCCLPLLCTPKGSEIISSQTLQVHHKSCESEPIEIEPLDPFHQNNRMDKKGVEMDSERPLRQRTPS